MVESLLRLMLSKTNPKAEITKAKEMRFLSFIKLFLLFLNSYTKQRQNPKKKPGENTEIL